MDLLIYSEEMIGKRATETLTAGERVSEGGRIRNVPSQHLHPHLFKHQAIIPRWQWEAKNELECSSFGVK